MFTTIEGMDRSESGPYQRDSRHHLSEIRQFRVTSYCGVYSFPA